MEIHANSRLILGLGSKEDTYKKLRVWGLQKCKPCVSAISAQNVTDLRNNHFPSTAYIAANGNSRKFTANPRVREQGRYLQEAEGMGTSKM